LKNFTDKKKTTMKHIRIISALLLWTFAIQSQAADSFGLDFIPEWIRMPLYMFALIAVPVALVIFFVGMGGKVFRAIWYFISLQPIRRYFIRKRLSKGLEYYRDLPAGGNLKIANAIMNSISSSWKTDYSGLFGALILRLVGKEALNMDYRSTMYGTEPHAILSVNKTVPSGKKLFSVEEGFYQLLKNAAGFDGVLQPRELQQYIRNNYVSFFNDVSTLTEAEKAIAQKKETAQQLLALRKYLLDFSLIREREIKELTLWKEYLIYATLFGIADKVCENFATVYPDYFKMNSLAATQLNVVGNNALVSYIDASMEGFRKKRKKKKKI